MGMTPNPRMAALQAIMGRLAQAGGPQQQLGAGAGANPNNAGSMLAQQSAQLKNADPGAIHNTLKQMKSQVAALIPQTAQSIPGIARYLAPLLKGLDGAIKEAQQAEQVMSAMGGPVGLSAAQPGAGPGGMPMGPGMSPRGPIAL